MRIRPVVGLSSAVVNNSSKMVINYILLFSLLERSRMDWIGCDAMFCKLLLLWVGLHSVFSSGVILLELLTLGK
jgi:hypothetical protein